MDQVNEGLHMIQIPLTSRGRGRYRNLSIRRYVPHSCPVGFKLPELGVRIDQVRSHKDFWRRRFGERGERAIYRYAFDFRSSIVTYQVV